MNTVKTEQALEAIKKFELEDACLDQLNKWTEGVNFFDITKISRQEIRHSNFLAWLFDAKETHNLGDKIIKEFLRSVIRDRDLSEIHKILNLDFESFEVRREWNHLDIFLVSTKEKFAIAIENKVGAQESEQQTERYRKVVSDIYHEYKTLYIFLSPDGLEAQDEEWSIATYEDVAHAIRTNLDSAQEEVRILLKHYLNTLERKVIMSEELRQICQDIYQKHKTAFDLIYQYTRTNRAQIYDLILNFLKEHEKEFNLRPVREDWGSGSLIRFTSNKLYSKFGNPEVKTNWNEPIDCPLVYEIYVPKDLQKVTCWLVASNPENPLNQLAIQIGDKNRGRSHINRRSNGKFFAHVYNVEEPLLEEGDLEDDMGNVRKRLEERLYEVFTTETPKYEDFLLAELEKGASD